MKTKTAKQQGIGLIEVLVTTVVIALGLLAIASLQTGFIKSSGDSKIRGEALVLAERKVEELRNQITQTGFDAVPNSASAVADPGNPIAGTNANFTRTWVINQGGTADRKNISVKVCWDAADVCLANTEANDKKVNIMTEMVFSDPAKSALYAREAEGGGSGAVPSPRQNASEDVSAASESVVGTDLAITDLVTSTVGTAGVDSKLQVDPSGTVLILYQVAPGSHFYTATHNSYGPIAEGVIAVFLCNDADDNLSTPDTCSHIQNHFGGVVHRIMGTVYSTGSTSLGDIGVAWTSSEVHACYQGAVENDGSLQSMPYECVFAGNCNTSPEGTRTDNISGDLSHNADPGCFVDSVVSDDQINSRDVGPGGEYGDLGLFGMDYQGGGQEQVCFLEDTVHKLSPFLNTSGNEVLNENYLYAVTKRLYVTRQVQRTPSDGGNEFKSEGINRSYTNHNFFIITRGNGADAKEKCNTELKDPDHSAAVAPREIVRALNQGTDNVVVSEMEYTGSSGTAYTLTGNVTGSATDLNLYIPETGTCYLNNNLSQTAATGYACVVAENAVNNDIMILGSSHEHKNVSPSVFAACTRPEGTVTEYTSSGCDWLADYTNSYNDGGTVIEDCSTPWGDVVSNGNNTDAATDTPTPYYALDDCNTPQYRQCVDGVLGSPVTAIYEDTESCEAAQGDQSCPSPWLGGPDIADGSSVNVYTEESVPYGQTCPDAVVFSCNNGSYGAENDALINDVYQSCTVNAPCIVPNINGDSTVNGPEDVIQSIIDAGFSEDNITANQISSGVVEASNQSPAAYTPQVCASTAVSFDYNQNCVVPMINEMSTSNGPSDVISFLRRYGYVGDANEINTGKKEVSNQSPVSGTESVCGSTVTFDFNQ